MINYNNFGKQTLTKNTAQTAKAAACEGAVLLKNDKNVLPIQAHETVSVFGRTQFDYIKSGTGSGGLVNVEYSTNITDSLKTCININEELAEIYKKWIADNPFDKGEGWACEPWFQKEMPVSGELVHNASLKSDKAIVVIGRTAGEDKDNSAEKGSYFLTDSEYSLIKTVSEYFEKTCVLLNVGNIIDTSWAEKLEIPSVMYIWQGGMEGGNAAADLVCGTVSPSGKLSDTVMYNVFDYPPVKNFGSADANKYEEDIYVGYRYFETFAKNEVMYPFGYGLSYTDFDVEITDFNTDGEKAYVSVSVKNIGSCSGKEVVQIYVNPPMGTDGRPVRELADFAKTRLLSSGEIQDIAFDIPMTKFKRYCETGENKFCYVVEKGDYGIYAGTDVRSAKIAGKYSVSETIVLEKLQSAMPPVEAFKRIKPVLKSGNICTEYEDVPQRKYDLSKRIEEGRSDGIPITGDVGITLCDVSDGKYTLDEFVAQLSEDDLMCIVRGEGMNSPKVTPGTAGAFGGVTKRLFDFGIPIACCTDGPSGIRMDNGATASSIPNGTCLACSWNTDIVEKLYEEISLELLKHNIDSLLGPGINIHRTPLCGRNFEYFSEDPYLTGKMAAAVTRGINKHGSFATVKHFVCNEQEYRRSYVDAQVSERALREIYLKPFEIAVKEGNTKLIMTSYNPINGIRAAGNYDLNTTILREEWKYDGIVMTDWWAMMNNEGKEGSKENLSALVKAQNDIYMVCDSAENHADNLKESLDNGILTLGELQRNAKNICRVIMDLPVYKNKSNFYTYSTSAKDELAFTCTNVPVNEKLDVRLSAGHCRIEMEYSFNGKELSQNAVKLVTDTENTVMMVKGTNGNTETFSQDFSVSSDTESIMFESASEISIKTVYIYKLGDVK